MIDRYQGVGIGFRSAIASDILASDGEGFSFLEIVPENYVGRGGATWQMLEEIARRWPVLAHGVSMSLGGRDPFDDAYVEGLKKVLDVIDAPFYTDHLCYATFEGYASHELLPLPFTPSAARHAADRIKALRDRLNRPIAVENIAYYAVMPGSTLTGAEFVRQVVEQADCGLLLDVNNVYVNAQNHGLDAHTVLEELPLDRVVQYHIAGHLQEGPRLLDNHGRPLHEDVLALYAHALTYTGKKPTLLEWDLNIPPYAEVLAEASRVREVFDAAQTRDSVEHRAAAPGPQGDLGPFFETMHAFLLGRTDVDDVEARLGPSPTGPDNLAFYPRFLRRHEQLALGRLFPAVKASIERAGQDWTALCAAFIDEHVPHHWSLHRMGAPFADWLQTRIEAGDPIPAEAPFLADYAWTRWLARNAPEDAPLLEGTAFVRQYPLDVVTATRTLTKEPDGTLPAAAPRALVIYRNQVSGKVAHFEPSLATLAVLDLASGESETDWAAHGLTDGMLANERRLLDARGLFRPTPIADQSNQPSSTTQREEGSAG